MGSSYSSQPPDGFRSTSTASTEAVQKNEAMVVAYESRTHYSLPKTPMKPKVFRESGTVPLSVAYLLDGGPAGDYILDDTESEEDITRPQFTCFWGYYAAIIAVFLITIILAILSIYFEMVAYQADREWNRVLEGSSTFTHVVQDDDYFAGKTFLQCHKIVPTTLDAAHVKTVLLRDEGLEIAFLVLILVFILGALAHPIALGYLVFKRKEKMRFNVTKFGILGILLFIASIFLIMSTLVKIPGGFIDLRIDLEEKVGVEPVADYHLQKLHGHDPSHKKFHSCAVNDTAPNHDELSQLLLVMKMCAYRYVEMNQMDACRNIPIPSHLVLNGTAKQYSVNDFQELGICSNDKNKLIAVLLNFTNAVFCWIIMSLGSYLKLHIKANLTQHKIRKTLIDISDVTAPEYDARRDAVPRQAPPLELNGKGESVEYTKETIEVNEPIEEDGSFVPQFPMFRTDSGLFDTKMSKMQSNKERHVTPVQRPPRSSVFTNSVMTLAPDFVIHPTLQSSNVKKRRNSIWFNYS